MDDKDGPRRIHGDLTLQDVADIFRINRETVRLWIQAGEFPNAYALPHGAGWRVPFSDVEALRERGRVRPYSQSRRSGADGTDQQEEAG